MTKKSLTTATPLSEFKRAHKRRMQKRAHPAKMTVTDLIEDEGVPVGVRHWLERFIEQGDAARAHFNVNKDEATMEQARLIFDVLNSKYMETGTGLSERIFPEEARDYIEEYLYRLAIASDIQVWNFPEAAVAALPSLLDCAYGNSGNSPDLVALQSAVERLTTRQERHEFLTGERYTADTEDARNIETAYRLSLLLADPATSQEVVNELDRMMIEFGAATSVLVSHPALVKRAFLVMCGTKIRGRARETKAARDRITAYLDQLDASAKVEDAA